ncbi:PREDICTED: ADP-ribosyl cyclase 1 [Elephantulus edwardii]|uniref:ADP-ribosyl cyclase 1 n=1 Tax=Elephantulus edwardii TaxID=28737 RepID=UPI0003F0987F|nr:PREDICTED: ADP-ribosyl cyclase 1 [Elephantulus edwardii]
MEHQDQAAPERAQEESLTPLRSMDPETSPRRSPRRLIWLLCFCALMALVVVVAVTVFLLVRPSEPLQWGGPGTTAHISEIALGRCYSYTQLLRSELRDKNCQEIWKAFKKAFISKNPCHVTQEDYKPLLKLANQTVPSSKSLLWSKTKDLAHQYTRVQQDMFTLEDTLLGYMADGLTWCGDPGTSDMNYQSCPQWRGECNNSAVTVFWKTISKNFAESASGEVYVMLNGSAKSNGSSSEIFDKNSIFGSVEVVHLNPARVHSLQAWVIHNIGAAPKDSCSDSSIGDLRLALSQRNIAFSCKNDHK